MVCAFCGFQAEHPLVLQIKQRKSWKPRFLFWGGIYGEMAGLIALYFAFTTTSSLLPLLGIYAGAIFALIIDAVSVLRRGVIGTLHHLYFAGTPSFIVAMGAVASALEVVPLTLIGFEVVKTIRFSEQAEGFYRWPLRFFLATCFWNLVGAGVFGFLINPPIVLYYSQGLNTTPIHAHSALFGVYRCLAIALMLFALREIVPDRAWNGKLLNFSFWSLNGGLGLMLVCGLISNGFYQLLQSINHGSWYARSAEVIHSHWMEWTVWLRLPGDVLFSFGAIGMVLFTVRAVYSIFQQPTDLSSEKITEPETAESPST